MTLNIKQNYPLKQLTTMQLGGPASFFAQVKNIEQVGEAVNWAKQKKLAILILGGGSNLIISQRGFDGLVIKVNIQGIKTIKENDKYVWLELGAGEIWDKIVAKAVSSGWWGIENLSDIPGSVGATVIQNVGAYGVEIEDVIQSLQAYDIRADKIKTIKLKDCGFSYRQSIFKGAQRGRYVILNVVIRLSKKGQVNLDYHDVREYFSRRNIKQPSLAQARRALLHIRASKLPNLKINGNCGSMFLNLVLDNKTYNQLKNKIKKNFSQTELDKLETFKKSFWSKKGIKIPTAWLIEICGLKGKQFGQAQIYKKWPLAIVNKNNRAKVSQVMSLIREIRQRVYKKTGMVLEPEVNLVGFSQKELKAYFKLN